MRLAGHDLMDFRKHASGQWTGGSDGCINFNDGDNKGLKSCIVAIGIKDVYEKICDKISLADFMVVAAEAVMSRAAKKYDAANPWGKDSLEARFLFFAKLGRQTNENCNEKGLMPNPENGCNDVEKIFLKHIFP